MIKLREALFEDAARLYALRMDGDAVAYSGTEGPESFLAHLVWLEQRLSHPEQTVIVVARETDSSECVGYARLDHNGDRSVVVSVAVDKRWRGRGYARQIVTELTGVALRVFPTHARLVAVVKEDNLVSLRLFWGLGFRPPRGGGPREDGRVELELAPGARGARDGRG